MRGNWFGWSGSTLEPLRQLCHELRAAGTLSTFKWDLHCQELKGYHTRKEPVLQYPHAQAGLSFRRTTWEKNCFKFEETDTVV